MLQSTCPGRAAGPTTREVSVMNPPSSVLLDLPLDEIRAFCQCDLIRRMALFGSALRSDYVAKSDIDLLVEHKLRRKSTINTPWPS